MRLTLLLDSKFGQIIFDGALPKQWPKYTAENPKQVVVSTKNDGLDMSIEAAGNVYKSKKAIDNWKSLIKRIATHTEL